MGPFPSEPITTKHTVQGSLKGVSFCKTDMQGWRPTMEDRCIHEFDIGDGNSLFAVIDGHGGHQISQYVQKNLIKILMEQSAYKRGNYADAFDEAFVEIDKLLSTESVKDELCTMRNPDKQLYLHYRQQISLNSGCTALVVLITPTHYYVANAGDSRSVLRRGGVALAMSVEHRTNIQSEYQRIKNAGSSVTFNRVNGGLNLTRALGDFSYKYIEDLQYFEQAVICMPEVRVFDRSNSDEFILLGSDGIWEKYCCWYDTEPDEEETMKVIQDMTNLIKDKLDKEVPQKQIVEQLLNDLVASDVTTGIGCDNMSVILIVF